MSIIRISAVIRNEIKKENAEMYVILCIQNGYRIKLF